MSGSTIARVLVALCIGSAVNCMPKSAHRSRRQGQQHQVPSASQGKCFSQSYNYLTTDLCKSELTGSHQRSLEGLQRVNDEITVNLEHVFDICC